MSKDIAHVVRGGQTLCGLDAPFFGSTIRWFGYEPKCPSCVRVANEERRDKRSA